MQEERKKKRVEPAQAMAKAQAWCAFQERCQQEARDKLYSWGLYPGEVEHLVTELISAGFIDEERYAKAFAGGKFRVKKWGRVKIRQELKRRKLGDYCIRKGLQEIDPEAYYETLKNLATEKSRKTAEKHPLKKKYKIMSYLLSRGFEADLVREVMGE